MSVQTIRIGEEQTPIVVIDNFFQNPDEIVQIATDLAPFPAQKGHYYPGLRHRITPQDLESFAYVEAVCRGLAGIMEDVYGIRKYDILDAGFSLMTLQPDDLQPLQKIPHFDHHTADGFAIIHYLSKGPSGGTAFYKHARTGFETLTDARLEAYAQARETDIREYGVPSGYHSGDRSGFIELASVEARFNRAAIYPGRILHTGIVPENFNFSPDPRRGRLTANIFVRALS